jgi:hypothetical protein
MNTFKPSGNFTARVMAEVDSYELAMISDRDRIPMLLQSKFVLSVLSAAGVLFGIINCIRFALILIAPALCL